MKTIIFILFLVVSGCVAMFEKPFIIINKDCGGDDMYDCYFTYQDKNGRLNVFRDRYNKYSIGDTIK
jgi:hypothetical protein